MVFNNGEVFHLKVEQILYKKKEINVVRFKSLSGTEVIYNYYKA